MGIAPFCGQVVFQHLVFLNPEEKIVNKSAVSFLVSSAIVLCLCFLVLPVAALAMDADELIAKNTEAIGGLEKIKSIKSMFIEGNILAQGMEIPFSMTQKHPNKMVIKATVMGMTMTQCFADGEGWSINPMMGATEPQPMPEMEAKSFALQADMEGPLIDYKKKGYTVEYIGEEDVEGTPAHRISLDTHDGIVMDFYMDTEFFLVILQEGRMSVDGNDILSQTYMSDFQEVDGLIIPYAVETKMSGMTVSSIMFKTVVLNGDVDDSIFAKPVAAGIKE